MPSSLAVLALVGCMGDLSLEEADAGLQLDRGVDGGEQVIRIGTINDESGPGRAIGGPFAAGKRVLAARINAGGSELLPDGWTVALVEHDAASDPEKVAAAFESLQDEVLFIGTSFGTRNTIALREGLNQHSMVAFPASLSSEMAKHPFTPPLGASYKAEARRAVDFMVEQAGGIDAARLAVVYRDDLYGADALAGFRAAARQYDTAVVAEIALDPADVAAAPRRLTKEGATHVMLAVMPEDTAALLAAAHGSGYAPTWVGSTPAWVDGFFDGMVPPAHFATYFQANSLPYWGEDVPGMADLVQAWDDHADGAPKGFYALLSYAQGLAGISAAKRALDAGDITRQGYYRALTSLRAFDGGGLVRPIDLSSRPYALNEEVRILEPSFERRTWTMVMDYARPGAPPRERPGQEAMGDANAIHPPGEGL